MMDFLSDKMLMGLALVFGLFLAALIMEPDFAGLTLIGALLFFGAVSLTSGKSRIKLAALVLLVLLALINIGVSGVKFGIDFAGGTRIPVLLEHPVDEETMAELVQTVKTRASALGLSEVKVRAVGDSQVDIELPSSDLRTIEFIESTLTQRGVFEGIVDGKVAVSGDHIYSTSIRSVPSTQLASSSADWGVAFDVDREGAEQFAENAKGKADYPIYMFLDRPTDAVVVFERSDFRARMLSDSGEKESLKALREALSHEERGDIGVHIIEDGLENVTPYTDKTVALVSPGMNATNRQMLIDKGFAVEEALVEGTGPVFSRSAGGVLIISSMESVGLISGPLLSPEVTNGVPNYGYVISGRVSATDQAAKAAEADSKVKGMISVLKGGSLPVQISLGSRTTLPASLGNESLRLSMIAIVLALVLIAVLIGLRYRNVQATLPIVLISLAELAILVSILGRFTIDLTAMAGIIAAIGVGVDAQIVITDEMLKKDHLKMAEKIGLAFDIIKTNAIVAISSMIPLFFSGIVEVTGFALSTILGAMLGYLLTRPAYAAIVENVLRLEKEAEKGESGAVDGA